MAAQPARELVVDWPSPDPTAWTLLKELGATAVLTPPAAKRPELSGIQLIADLPAVTALDQLERAISAARTAGYDGVAVVAAGDESAFRALLQRHGAFIQFVSLKPDQLPWNVSPARAVFTAGLSPGLQATDTSTAGATEQPWINTNLHLYAYLRALHPERAAWLRTEAPKPDVRYESLEVALAEAYASGGSSILAVPGMYREGLLKSVPRALTSWKSLCALSAGLRQMPAFDRANLGSTTAIITGPFDESEELLNLSYRTNLSPRVIPLGSTQRLTGLRVLAAVNQDLTPEQGRAATEFARSGGILVAAPSGKDDIPWLTAANPRKLKDEKPWSLWELGSGRVYRYPEAIMDPSAFSFDLREISGLDNPRHTGLQGLDFRVWNAATVLGVLYEAASGGKQLVLISYGRGITRDFLIGVRGNWKSAVMRQPGEPVQTMQLMPRGWFIEADIKATGRLAVIELQGAQP